MDFSLHYLSKDSVISFWPRLIDHSGQYGEKKKIYSCKRCLAQAESVIHTPLCKAVQPMMSTASTFASFSSNKETASMCPYATASISGVLGRQRYCHQKDQKNTHHYPFPFYSWMWLKMFWMFLVCYKPAEHAIWLCSNAKWNGVSRMESRGWGSVGGGSFSKYSCEPHHLQNYVALTKPQLAREDGLCRNAVASNTAALLPWHSVLDFCPRFHFDKISLP